MKRQIIYFTLLLLLVADITYSFLQHLKTPLDGDMASHIVPSEELKKVLGDPFGISVITDDAVYQNPNRFFAHWTFYEYFRRAPALLQNAVDPIDSVYLSCALAKIVIQILIIFLLAFYITGTRKVFNKEFVLAALLMVPLFQTNGYRSYMGIIDPSPTYTFFYALPCALLLLFYLPFFSDSYYRTNFTSNRLVQFLLIGLAVFITLNGPIIPGIVLVISLLFLLHNLKRNYVSRPGSGFFQRVLNAGRSFPGAHLLFFALISVLSIYSLYVGANNTVFPGDNIPVSERYSRLPSGLFELLTQKLGWFVFLLMIGINSFLIGRYFKDDEGKKILNWLKWIGIFSLIYILLLPLGGYRFYRPGIVRYDTIMPITLGLIFIYGISSLFLIRSLKGNAKKWYLPGLIGFSFIFSFADEPEFGKNECEREAFQTIAQSKDSIVLLESDCTIMAWDKIHSPDESELNAQLLEYWGITDEKKLYYQK